MGKTQSKNIQETAQNVEGALESLEKINTALMKYRKTVYF